MSLQEDVRNAGVIGAGGAGFPTYVKLQSPAEYLILNSVECEPLLQVDQELMKHYPKEIIRGFCAAREAVGAKKGIIGIKEKHQEIIVLLQQTIDELGVAQTISIHPLKDVYPMGDEQVLVYEVTGRVVPELSIPLSVGCVVMNTETVLNLYHAMAGTPVTETYITVAGDVPQSVTIKVPVGTPLMDVLVQSGRTDFTGYSVLDGGPMMGEKLKSLDVGVTKKSKGYIVLKDSHLLSMRKSIGLAQAERISRATCEQCRMCTDLCPRYLLGHQMEPHKIMRGVAFPTIPLETMASAQLCCECGVCELYACPIQLQPKQMNMLFKGRTANEKIRYEPTQTEFSPRSVREYRLLPSKSLVRRLGLTPYLTDAPLIETALLPKEVQIATRQHIGAAAVPTVQVGQLVNKGECIGRIPEDSLGAPIHASVTGRVTFVDERMITIEVKDDV